MSETTNNNQELQFVQMEPTIKVSELRDFLMEQIEWHKKRMVEVREHQIRYDQLSEVKDKLAYIFKKFCGGEK